MTSASEFDVVIAGAGLVGASFALAIRGSGLRVALLGPLSDSTDMSAGTTADASENGWDRRIYAISPDSMRFLDTLGVWSQMDPARVQACLAMEVAGDSRRGRIGFSAFEAGVPALAYMTESRAIAHPMARLLRASPELVLMAQAVSDSQQRDSGLWRVELADGNVLTTRLLVGADGGESAVRHAAGLSARAFDYRQQALVANYATEQPHGAVAFQWFRSPDVLAYLPLPGERISVVWSLPAERAAELVGLPAADVARRVAEAGEHRLGRLTPLGEVSAFPLQILRVPAIVGQRLALIGDAAHIVHPLAGMGVNLGFRDARALANAIHTREIFRDCGDPRVLSRYARVRSEDILSVQTFTHAMQRLFALSWAPAAVLRNAGLNLVDRLPVVKEQLMHRALAA